MPKVKTMRLLLTLFEARTLVPIDWVAHDFSVLRYV
jgi:hypothetical protein